MTAYIVGGALAAGSGEGGRRQTHANPPQVALSSGPSEPRPLFEIHQDPRRLCFRRVEQSG